MFRLRSPVGCGAACNADGDCAAFVYHDAGKMCEMGNGSALVGTTDESDFVEIHVNQNHFGNSKETIWGTKLFQSLV